MTADHPLLAQHQSRDALLSVYGPDRSGAPIVQTFGQLDLEYAALRTHCVLFDAAHRATLEITGADRLTFLNAMVTQRVGDMTPGTVRETFWLNRKGRIIADLRLIELGDRMLVDLDTLVAGETAASLSEFLFSEDAAITDKTNGLRRLWLIGPTAPALLNEATGLPKAASIETVRACETTINGAPIVIARSTLGDVPLFELTVASANVEEVYERLLTLGQSETEPGEPAAGSPSDSIRLRPTGWHAINVARIESGVPMFNLDFASTNLPAETSLLASRVDFKKGCYLGQEIVARMDALGKPTRSLVALRIEASDAQDQPPQAQTPQAETGAELFPIDNPEKSVGAVTSSCISPMLSAASICFAMVRWGSHEPGTRLSLTAEGRDAIATVQPSLTFWPRAEQDGSAERR